MDKVLTEILPVIISLIIIEGLLSVDNALAIAAMANKLPGKQKIWALRLGIIGAYAFRGVALLLAQWIMHNIWIKYIGAGYLIYLMCSHLTQKEHKGEVVEDGKKLAGKNFWITIAQIELMDLSLSVDNVIAAVALHSEFWVVCTGVFIGILALRLVAGYCILLIDRFPILNQTAFLLVGYVGGLLLHEMLTHEKIHVSQKFIGILLIIAACIIYDKSPFLKAAFKPFMPLAFGLMRFVAITVEWPFRLVWLCFHK